MFPELWPFQNHHWWPACIPVTTSPLLNQHKARGTNVALSLPRIYLRWLGSSWQWKRREKSWAENLQHAVNLHGTSLLFSQLTVEVGTILCDYRRGLSITLAHFGLSIGRYLNILTFVKTELWFKHNLFFNSLIATAVSPGCTSHKLRALLFIACPLNGGRQLPAEHTQCKDSTKSSSVTESQTHL